MATITVETVEKLNISQVLQALEQERKAEALLDAQSKALGASKKELVKVIRDQERAAKREAAALEVSIKAGDLAAASTGRISAGMASLRSQLLDIGTSLQGGMNPLTILSQQGPQVAEALSTMGAAGVSALAPLAPLAAAVAFAAGSYLIYKTNVEEAAEAQKKAKEEAEESAKIYRQLADATVDASIEAKVLAGDLTEAEAASAKAAIAIGDRFGGALEKAGDKMRDLRAEYKRAQEEGKDTEDATEQERAAFVKLSADLAKAEDEYDKLGNAVTVLTDAQQNNIKTTDEQTRAHQAAKDALKAEKDELKELLFLMGVDEEIAKVNAGLYKVEQEELAKTTAAVAAYTAEMEANGDAREKMILDDIEATTKWKEKRIAAQKSILESAESTVGSLSDIWGSLYEQQAEAAKDGTHAQKMAALETWRTQQTMAAAEAGINTILAISQALAAAPFPANVPLVAAATASGVAQEVAIASQPPPSFDDAALPPISGAAEGRRTLNVHQQDYVAAAKDPLNLMRNAERATAGAPGMRPPSTARALAAGNVGLMLTQQLYLTVRGQRRAG